MTRPGIEEFPRRPLSFRYTRRELFGSLRSELERRRTSDPGLPAYKLTTLGDMPDERLASIVPVLISECRPSVVGGAVCIRDRMEGPPRKLFPADPANLLVLDAIDGRRSLGTIAEALANQMPGLGERAFAQVRNLFLVLVEARAAVPA